MHGFSARCGCEWILHKVIWVGSPFVDSVDSGQGALQERWTRQGSPSHEIHLAQGPCLFSKIVWRIFGLRWSDRITFRNWIIAMPM